MTRLIPVLLLLLLPPAAAGGHHDENHHDQEQGQHDAHVLEQLYRPRRLGRLLGGRGGGLRDKDGGGVGKNLGDEQAISYCVS